MAKISAHGSRKLTERSFDVTSRTPDSFLGDVTRYIYVLRSDGAILSTTSWPAAQSSYDRKRGGYRIVGRIREGGDLLEVFNRYVDRRQGSS